MIVRLNFVFSCIIRKIGQNNSLHFSSFSIQVSVIFYKVSIASKSAQATNRKQYRRLFLIRSGILRKYTIILRICPKVFSHISVRL